MGVLRVLHILLSNVLPSVVRFFPLLGTLCLLFVASVIMRSLMTELLKGPTSLLIGSVMSHSYIRSFGRQFLSWWTLWPQSGRWPSGVIRVTEPIACVFLVILTILSISNWCGSEPLMCLLTLRVYGTHPYIFYICVPFSKRIVPKVSDWYMDSVLGWSDEDPLMGSLYCRKQVYSWTSTYNYLLKKFYPLLNFVRF